MRSSLRDLVRLLAYRFPRVSRRNINRFARVVAVLFVVALIAVAIMPSKPVLRVLVGCDPEVFGTLSIAKTTDSLETKPVTTIDVKAACEQMSVDLAGYSSDSSIIFTLKRNDNEMAELISHYGENIQADRAEGFFMIIKLIDKEPYILNDSI